MCFLSRVVQRTYHGILPRSGSARATSHQEARSRGAHTSLMGDSSWPLRLPWWSCQHADPGLVWPSRPQSALVDCRRVNSGCDWFWSPAHGQAWGDAVMGGWKRNVWMILFLSAWLPRTRPALRRRHGGCTTTAYKYSTARHSTGGGKLNTQSK